MAKPELRARARELRKKGHSVREIARMTGAANSSVSLWVRDIELTPEQKQHLARRNPFDPANREGRAKAARKARRTWRKRRERFQEEGRSKAQEGDLLHAMGCMLYWAEGAKAQQRNSASLSNSDPALLRLFQRFLIESLGVDPAIISYHCQSHSASGVSEKQLFEYRQEQLGFTDEQWRKPTWDRRSRTGHLNKAGKLPYGVLTITVHRTQVVQHIFGAIQEYGGFERPEWLD